MSNPGMWEKWATKDIISIVEEYACRPWKELRRAMIEHGPSPDGSQGSWPYKAWLKAKRKVLSGEAWGLSRELPPRTHNEAIARMLREFEAGR